MFSFGGVIEPTACVSRSPRTASAAATVLLHLLEGEPIAMDHLLSRMLLPAEATQAVHTDTDSKHDDDGGPDSTSGAYISRTFQNLFQVVEGCPHPGLMVQVRVWFFFCHLRVRVVLAFSTYRIHCVHRDRC